MFGFKLVHKSEVELWEARLADQKYMLDRMEVELHYWQKRADDERERADRIGDALNLQNGLPEVTNTVIRVKQANVEQMKELVDKKESEIAEMFSDSLDGEDDLNWVDADLQVAARGWMDQAKQARDIKKEVKS